MPAKPFQHHKSTTRRAARPSQNKLRIIAGKYRGRRFDFPAIEGLRPTADRVRETLFNWLTPAIGDARCVDLFAGSGALSLEALSRGASEVIMLERSSVAAGKLRQHVATLGARNAQVISDDALRWLGHPDRQRDAAYDIVFVDPPFGSELLTPCCQLLATCGLLHPGSFIYLEYEQALQPTVPSTWQLHRSGAAGQAAFALYRASAGA